MLQRIRYGFLAEASLHEPSYHCDAVVAKTSRLVAIRRDAFVEALPADIIRDGWIGHLARELRKARAQAERLSLKTAPERIVHYIESVGERGVLHLGQSKKDWAADLGLTHEALYRALARMEKQGQLTVHRAKLILR